MSGYEGKDLVKSLVDRAMTDDAFRKEFVSNPEGVIEKETGQKIPAGLHIRVFEETPTTVCIVVPAKFSEELSDAQLENVAGGAAFAQPIIRNLASTPFRIISGPGLRADWGIGGCGFQLPGQDVANPLR